ncbi:hypothetical protein KA107_00640 [Candidatus Pacearchaeota archaeon]|nr:hypothetical protein [Candidatus Pacearchaeota archaeon]
MTKTIEQVVRRLKSGAREVLALNWLSLQANEEVRKRLVKLNKTNTIHFSNDGLRNYLLRERRIAYETHMEYLRTQGVSEESLAVYEKFYFQAQVGSLNKEELEKVRVN